MHRDPEGVILVSDEFTVPQNSLSQWERGIQWEIRRHWRDVSIGARVSGHSKPGNIRGKEGTAHKEAKSLEFTVTLGTTAAVGSRAEIFGGRWSDWRCLCNLALSEEFMWYHYAHLPYFI